MYMMKLPQLSPNTVLIIMVFPSIYIYIMFSSYQIAKGYYNSENLRGYLVYSNSCKIPNLSPFNWEARRYFEKFLYVPCRKLDLLTYITKNKENTKATLHIDVNVISAYSSDGVRCCLSTIIRNKPERKLRENTITITPCQYFNKSIELPSSTVAVNCTQMNSNQTIYSNIHAPILLTEEIKRRQQITSINNFNQSVKNESISVLIIGVDSVSRLNILRTMPHTYAYLKETNWIEMQGYNKIGDNTFHNVMAMLTGKNNSEVNRQCEGWNIQNCNFIWNFYKMHGYATALAEDISHMGTFNYLQKGFYNEPVDYYFRPYYLAVDKLNVKYQDNIKYCSGPESNLERTLDIAEDFAITFKGKPSFGLFWTNIAHESLNILTRHDLKFKQFFQRLSEKGVLDQSVVIFLSDHGARFGDIRTTYTGWLETRLPMLFVWIPRGLRKQHPNAYDNMRSNGNKLTNPYDLYMTMQDILLFSGYNHSISQAESCLKCNSLFKYVDTERSCADASIDKYWCTCDDYKYADIEGPIVAQAKKCSLAELHRLIASHKDGSECATYSIHRTLSAKSMSNNMYVMVVFQTAPYAIFEVLVKLDPFSKQCTRDISINRVNSIAKTSYCTSNKDLELLCYCL